MHTWQNEPVYFPCLKTIIVAFIVVAIKQNEDITLQNEVAKTIF
jgi:hypothetical protein